MGEGYDGVWEDVWALDPNLPCASDVIRESQSGRRPVERVVALGTETRAQNGYIRNDTRDVSRLISTAYSTVICSRNCAVRA
jgi:uncharacterized protein (DUF3084 family)